jgi:hypothetical protein
MRYAKLGAIGPDLFYCLMDYGSDLQNLTNFLVKLAGSFECLLDVTKDISDFVSKAESDLTLGISTWKNAIFNEFTGVLQAIKSIVNEGLMAVVIDQGYNFFPGFQARRQQDRPRDKWFWADYLHYVRTGQFVQALFEESKHDPNLRAFAFGYLSHYVTDVVGHPYVNEVVGAPWRMYWQRHHLVENFIGAYVWDRWHDAQPAPDSGEPPLDRVRTTPLTEAGQGAPFTYARLNDHVMIGYKAGSDPIDNLIQAIAARIKDGKEKIGIPETEPPPPDGKDFIEWTKVLAGVFQKAYPFPSAQPPDNLTGRYPTADDIASAYTIMRLFLRFSTEEQFQEPELPNVVQDVWRDVNKILDNLRAHLGTLTLPPPIPAGDPTQLNFEIVWKAIQEWVKWQAETAMKIAETMLDFVNNAIHAAGTFVLDSIKLGLYFIKKALFDIYKAFRHYLVRAAYAIPFSDELSADLVGGISALSAWTVPERAVDGFPVEEIPEIERQYFPSKYPVYPPWVPPNLLPEMKKKLVFEEPRTWAGPYRAGARPEAFIETPLGRRALLSSSGPMDLNTLPNPNSTFTPPIDFGGAVASCESAFTKVLTAQQNGTLPLFPDYNLDGDRGYAWPCWDVARPGTDLLDPTGGRLIVVKPALIR